MEKRAMICQPMNGISDGEIRRVRNRAVAWLQENGFTVENTLLSSDEYNREALENQDVKNIRIYFLGKSIEALSRCDTAYFCKGWDKAKGAKALLRSKKKEVRTWQDRQNLCEVG